MCKKHNCGCPPRERTIGHLIALAAQGRPLPKAFDEARDKARKEFAGRTFIAEKIDKLQGGDGSIDGFVRRAVGTAIGVWHIPPDDAWRMKMHDYEAALAEYERDLRRRHDFAGTPRKGGRPPKFFLTQLTAFAGAWLAVHGVPYTQAALERALLDECGRRGWHYSERQVRELASEMIAAFSGAMAD